MLRIATGLVVLWAFLDVIAGAWWADWLFMLGLVGVGISQSLHRPSKEVRMITESVDARDVRHALELAVHAPSLHNTPTTAGG